MDSALAESGVRQTGPATRRLTGTRVAILLLRVAGVSSAGMGVAWLGAALYATPDLTPEAGLGYVLGVAGTGCMVALGGYSLRKRVSVLRRAGPISYWFRIHMFLGIAGPVAILFHSGFRLGSMNSAVALITMLLVAGSGVVGRLIYSRIHLGLYGRRVTCAERREECSRARELLLEAGIQIPVELERLIEAAQTTGPPLGAVSAWRRRRAQHRRVRQVRRALRRIRSPRTRRRGPDDALAERLHAAVDPYLSALESRADLELYERLFTGWHALHAPLCVLLVLTVLAHVAAVHLY